jgi:hypothetical protein
LLAKEKRGQVTKYGMLGGKAKPDETDFLCMAREAKEETGGALSLITISRIADGRGILDGTKVYYENAKSWACKHDLVVPADLDVEMRIDASKACGQRSGRAAIQKKKRVKTQTQQLGIEFVPIESVRNWRPGVGSTCTTHGCCLVCSPHESWHVGTVKRRSGRWTICTGHGSSAAQGGSGWSRRAILGGFGVVRLGVGDGGEKGRGAWLFLLDPHSSMTRPLVSL